MAIYAEGKKWRVRVYCAGIPFNKIASTRSEAEIIERHLIGWSPSAIKRSRLLATPTTIYFIQEGADGPIKIGRADEPKKRLDQMQTGNHRELRLLTTVEAWRAEELALHKKFASLRIRGEWFHPGPELLALIETLGGSR